MKSQVFIGEERDRNQCLIVVFLRGGADGLTMVPPVEDDDYYRARPKLGIAKSDAVNLDGFFGLHPELAPLSKPFHDGAMAVVHGAGSEDTTRSHFEAQDFMEHGGNQAGGWLGRFLRARGTGATPLSAVAVGKSPPEALRGAPSMVVLDSFESFAFGENAAPMLSSLAGLYALEGAMLGSAGRQALAAVDRVRQLASDTYVPRHNAAYANDDFSQGMQRIAQLIRSRVGMEAACIDLPGWDSHFTSSTIMNPLMQRLANGLSAFYQDLGPEMDDVSVVVMSEFGRRVYENASYGTDHGRGGVMMMLGGGIRGGKIHQSWKGLNASLLEGPGDVPVDYNYRDVLAGVLARQGGEDVLSHVFPGYDTAPLNLYS